MAVGRLGVATCCLKVGGRIESSALGLEWHGFMDCGCTTAKLRVRLSLRFRPRVEHWGLNNGEGEHLGRRAVLKLPQHLQTLSLLLPTSQALHVLPRPRLNTLHPAAPPANHGFKVNEALALAWHAGDGSQHLGSGIALQCEILVILFSNIRSLRLYSSFKTA